jgi:hypothetical protein
MPIAGDLRGREFGKLRVVSLAGTGPRGKSWNCECDCGNKIKLPTFKLKKDGYQTCGCGRTKSEKRQPVPKHLARAHALTFTSWQAMLARCHYF